MESSAWPAPSAQTSFHHSHTMIPYKLQENVAEIMACGWCLCGTLPRSPTQDCPATWAARLRLCPLHSSTAQLHLPTLTPQPPLQHNRAATATQSGRPCRPTVQRCQSNHAHPPPVTVQPISMHPQRCHLQALSKHLQDPLLYIYTIAGHTYRPARRSPGPLKPL